MGLIGQSSAIVLKRYYATVKRAKREILRTIYCPSGFCDGQNSQPTTPPIDNKRAFSKGFSKGFS